MVPYFTITQPYPNITHGKEPVQLIDDKSEKKQKIKVAINYKQNITLIGRE